MGTLDWPTDPPTLVGEGHLLRPWVDRDVDAVFAACQDPDIQHWTKVPTPYSVEDARRFVNDMAPTLWMTRGGALFCVASTQDDRVLGSCGIVAVDAHDAVGQIGYWVAPRARRTGVATGAVAVLAAWAMADLGLRRVELRIDPDNEASCAVPRRLGWNREGPELWATTAG